MAHIFICHSSKDERTAHGLVGQLEENGVACWIAPRDIAPGHSWPASITRAIKDCSTVLLVLTGHANSSREVAKEITLADKAGKRVVVLRLEQTDLSDDLEYFLATTQWVEAPGAENLEPRLLKELVHAFGGKAREETQPIAAVSDRAVENLPAGAKRVNPKDGLTYVWIPEGGVVKGFWLGETPVTQAAYERVMGKNPSYFQGANRPVEQVSCDEAEEYCKAVGMRLPSEAEWKYAARAGTPGERYGDLDEIAWYAENSGGETHEVKQKKPNAWGLYDMLGNVWEWTADWYHSERQYRVLRGGSWNSKPVFVRVSSRYRDGPAIRDDRMGFRCAGEFR